MNQPAPQDWTRSTFCSDSTCVEVGQDGDHILIRDSTSPETVLAFDRAEWDAFLAGVRAGEFRFGGDA